MVQIITHTAALYTSSLFHDVTLSAVNAPICSGPFSARHMRETGKKKKASEEAEVWNSIEVCENHTHLPRYSPLSYFPSVGLGGTLVFLTESIYQEHLFFQEEDVTVIFKFPREDKVLLTGFL